MTIFNDQSNTPEQDEEMAKLKSGIEEAKKRMQEGRETDPVPEDKPKSRLKGKRK